mmetsp:Transcript_7627/g.20131  ORF Transcript_7627/g.20131 Transcript_7627/m.20131 type:complete len:229 (+) Transcript_7627:1672-2358(+)
MERTLPPRRGHRGVALRGAAEPPRPGRAGRRQPRQALRHGALPRVDAALRAGDPQAPPAAARRRVQAPRGRAARRRRLHARPAECAPRPAPAVDRGVRRGGALPDGGGFVRLRAVRGRPERDLPARRQEPPVPRRPLPGRRHRALRPDGGEEEGGPEPRRGPRRRVHLRRRADEHERLLHLLERPRAARRRRRPALRHGLRPARRGPRGARGGGAGPLEPRPLRRVPV